MSDHPHADRLGVALGCRVEYLGDVCNAPRVGTVTALHDHPTGGESFDLRCDPEGDDEPHEMRGVLMGVFEGIAPRFVLLGPAVELRHDTERRLTTLCRAWGCSREEAVRRAIIGALARVEQGE